MQLVSWFHREARDLPWRRTRDPYAIWVSEIMLQQTQVKTVVPYYLRWMKELPTIKALSEATESDLLKLWEGLGYYRRARNLQAAAQRLVDGGFPCLPTTLDGWLELPGIGPYTAGAIMSIAYNQAVPAVDGNVVRVICRLKGVTANHNSLTITRLVESVARTLVESASQLPPSESKEQALPCSALNQSLMELGATICTPREPECGRCPIQGFCVASQAGMTERIPAPRRRAEQERREMRVIVMVSQGKFLVRRRPQGGHNEDLWEFPGYSTHPEEHSPEGRALRRLLEQEADQEILGSLKHCITKYRISLDVCRISVARKPKSVSGEWVERSTLDTLAFPAAHRRIIREFLH